MAKKQYEKFSGYHAFFGRISEPAVELADKLNVDMIIMGKIGIGKSDSSIGNVSQQVVNLTTKPVVFID